jgi:predicted aconitase with swiveling domain
MGVIHLKEQILKGHRIARGKAEGEALVSRDRFSFWGTVDLHTGVVHERGHDLKGVCIKDKILIYPTGKGSGGGSARLYSLIRAGLGPKAILNVKAEVVTIIGAIMGNIPMMDQFEADPTESIQTGDYVRVDADNGRIGIIKKFGG